MKFKLSFLIFSIFLVSLIFSAGWEKSLDSKITTPSEIYLDKLIVGTLDGSVFALDKDTGSQIWKKQDLGDTVKTIDIFNNKLLVGLDSGTFYIMRDFGEIEQTFELDSQIYGVDVDNGKAYISSENGIWIFDGVNPKLIHNHLGKYSSPKVEQNKIFVGKNDELVAFDFSGNILWSTELGPFWDNKPVINGNNVYVGSMNHVVYSLNKFNGEIVWSYTTSGAITSDVFISSGTLYVASNDKNIYALNLGNGELKWVGKTNGGLNTNPIAGNIGSQNLVLVGSSDTYIYGFSRTSGDLIWGIPTKDSVDDVLALQGQIYVSSGDEIQSVTTQRNCIITDPSQRTKIGYREILVTGKVFSESSGAEVHIRVNNGPWELAQVDENKTFSYALDPNFYDFGSVSVECKITDNSGESDPVEIVLIRSNEFESPEFDIRYRDSVEEGQEITITVLDADTGEFIDNFEYSIGEETTVASERIVFNSGSPRDLEITFSKLGYQEKTILIKVNPQTSIEVYLLIGGVILAILLIIAWIRFFRPPKYE